MLASAAPPPIIDKTWAHTQAVKFFKLAVKEHAINSYVLTAYKVVVGKIITMPGEPCFKSKTEAGVAGCHFTVIKPEAPGIVGHCVGNVVFRYHLGKIQVGLRKYRCG